MGSQYAHIHMDTQPACPVHLFDKHNLVLIFMLILDRIQLNVLRDHLKKKINEIIAVSHIIIALCNAL